jgi:hypothetical protein
MRRRRIVALITLVVVAGLVGVAVFFTRNNASTAKVGDCVQQKGENSVSVVKCDDPKADFKVVGRVENKTQSDALISACDPFQNQGAEAAFWEGKQGETGFVLCLAKNK